MKSIYRRQLEDGDFATLFPPTALKEDLEFIKSAKNMMPPEMREYVKKIIDLIKFRIEQQPYSDQLYS
jgi:hypothetical protein